MMTRTNKLLALAVAGLGFLVGASSVFAGPPDEALGSDIVSEYNGDRVTFNAFELGPVTADRCRGKGSMVYTAKRSEGTYVYYIDIKYVNAQPDIGQVWFSGICTDTTLDDEYSTTNVGRWFVVKGWDSVMYEGPYGSGYLNGYWVDGSPPEDIAEAFVCGEGGITTPGPNTSGSITVQVHPKGLR